MFIDGSDLGGASCPGHDNFDFGASWTSSCKRQRQQADSLTYSPDCPTPKPGSHGYQPRCIQFPIYQSTGADNRRFSSGTPVIWQDSLWCTLQRGRYHTEEHGYLEIMADNGCERITWVRKKVFCCRSYLITFLISLQVRILLRAMNLLKHDGRIVYSTCSLNPVENEAVIAEALRINPGMRKPFLNPL